jgi:hypothetical protein
MEVNLFENKIFGIFVTKKEELRGGKMEIR